MTERWARLERIYHAAAALPEAERPSFLDRECADDAGLRGEAEAMLRHADTQYLDSPAAAMGSATPIAGSLTGGRLRIYDIGEVIGTGGMGEVYRARDTNLGRDVAVKVLPSEWLADPDRRARFEREARILASLNHPNIAVIHELETSTDVPALVMELVEGETLRDRLAGGPIPIREVVALAKQMADALEAAHEAGVVHRDFKPENVRVTPAGTIKVLDFGIATIKGASGAAATATGPRTKEGAVLGTAPYMSSEQACGKPVDRRTDVWAFGCVLYEMTTGHRAFAGETWSETLAAILERVPDWQTFPRSVPRALIGLIRRCLEKDPRQRLRDIGDARLELDALAAGGSAETVAAPRPHRLAWIALASVPVSIALGIVLDRAIRAPASPVRATNLSMPLAPGGFPSYTAGSEIAVAPDALSVAYVGAAADGHTQLYVQAFASTEPHAVKGGEDAHWPFYSPDGQWLTFFSGQQLKKIAVPDGPAQVICKSVLLRGPSFWAPDGTILIGNVSDAAVEGIKRVSPDCGHIDILTHPEQTAGEFKHSTPQAIAGSAAILFTATVQLPEGRKSRAMVLPAPGQRARVLVDDALQARYVGDGVLLYQRDTSIFATALDTAAWTVGPSRRMIDGVRPDVFSSAWSQARDVFVYRPHVEDLRVLTWVARDGTAQPLKAPPRRYDAPSLSPRGDRIAVEVQSDATIDAYIYDVARETLRPITFDGLSRYPLWTPDGSRLTISRRRQTTNDTCWLSAEGAGEPEVLKRNERAAFVIGWTRDLRTMLYSHQTTGGIDVWTFDRQTGRAQPLMVDATQKTGARLSPDDRWLAYLSNRTGAYELYVTSYPTLARQWQLTTGGASEPVWSADGRELFYRHGDEVLAIPVEARDSFVAGHARVLFSARYFQTVNAPGRRTYDVAPDGKHFLMIRSLASEAPALRVVLGFAPGAAK